MKSDCASNVLIQAMGVKKITVQESRSQISEGIKAPEEILRNRFQSHTESHSQRVG